MAGDTVQPGSHLEQLGLEGAHGGHAHNLAALGDDWELVEALPDHDVDGLLHGDAGQDGEGGRDLEAADLLLRPPGVHVLHLDDVSVGTPLVVQELGHVVPHLDNDIYNYTSVMVGRVFS